MQDFLPVTREEMKKRGWEQVDFVYVSGDAYVDHPSFGAAIIGRLLESRGYRVGMIPQPDWILWSIIIQFPKSTDKRMLILREDRWVFDLTGQWWSTAT